MASNWMFNNGIDNDEDIPTKGKGMSRSKAEEIVHVRENHAYGHYVYDSDEYQSAKKVLER